LLLFSNHPHHIKITSVCFCCRCIIYNLRVLSFMKVVLYGAQTINGIIATRNYDEDFLSHENWKAFLYLVREIGCFVVGRKTYATIKRWESYNFDKIKATKIIISKDQNFKLGEGYVLATSPEDALRKASRRGFKRILLTCSGKTNSAFMRNGLVDEIIINVELCLLGGGIRAFSEEHFEKR